jgi:signal transduction histidine kinase
VQSEISSTNLQNALEQLKIKTEKLYNVDCNLKYDSNVDIEDADTIQHIYRIAQEAVRNAVIHGNADVVEILLEQSEDGHSIIISDNGHGFSQSIKESTDVGIGITTMKYRAQLLGGRLKIDETGNGVRVTCIIPKN